MGGRLGSEFRRADSRLNSPKFHQLSSVSFPNGGPNPGLGNGTTPPTPTTLDCQAYAATLGPSGYWLTSTTARLITLLPTTVADDGRWKGERKKERRQTMNDGSVTGIRWHTECESTVFCVTHRVPVCVRGVSRECIRPFGLFHTAIHTPTHLDSHRIIVVLLTLTSLLASLCLRDAASGDDSGDSHETVDHRADWLCSFPSPTPCAWNRCIIEYLPPQPSVQASRCRCPTSCRPSTGSVESVATRLGGRDGGMGRVWA